MNFSVSHAEGKPPFIRPANLAWLIHQPFICQLMRISLLLMVFSLTCLTMLLATPGKGQGAETTTVTLELNDESLESALKKIEDKTPFRFVYRNREIKAADHITLPQGTRSVSETLQLLLANQSLTFRQINNNILIERKEESEIVSEPAHETTAVIQQTITGKVTSAGDNASLPGVSVMVKGTQSGTVTDAQGNYTLEVNAADATLIFSFIGYKTIEVAIGGRSTVDVSLDTDVTQLTEVVVTSFGIAQEKRSLGFSSQNVNGDNLIQTRQPNVVSALQGQVSGVQITNSAGAPGAGARIVIRGITSLDPERNNQPLFVIDGMPVDNSTIESPNTPRTTSNRLADINPNDIESVNILKGAAATALYGVRAANGAVVITTKKGKAGGVQINVTSSYGFQKINKFPDFQEEYGQGWQGVADRTSVYPAWGAPFSSASLVDPTYRFYDNSRDVYETGKTFDNHISVSGGNDIATFYTSIANTDQSGVIPASTWGRTSAKFSGTLKLKEKFSVAGSVTYTNSGGNRVPSDRFGETLMYYPTSSNALDYINPDGTQKYIGLSDNPIYSAKFRPYEDDVNRTMGSLFFSYKPLPWLSLNYRIGTDYYSDFRTEILPGPKGIEGETALDPDGGFMEDTRISSRLLNSNAYIEINQKLTEKLGLTFRAGHELFDEERNTMQTSGTVFIIPEYYQFNNVKQILTKQTLWQRRLIGVYGDLTLNYNDFLYLDVTGRNDWTSTLPKKNNSFFYPSANLSFILSDVVQLPAAITYTKLRTSYAQVGKDTDPYQTSTTYAATEGFPLNDQVGFTRNQIKGSADLKPERTTNIEFGAEMKFLNSRLGFEVTWYKANSKDQIFRVPVSNTTGYTRFVTNIGEIENKGIELMINATPVKTTDFSWDVSLNFTRNRNTVVDLAEGFEGGFVIGTQSGYVGSTVSMALTEGAPYGNLYGRSFQRYYGSETPADLTSLDRDKPLLIGANGFPVINTTQLIIGNAQPKWLAGLRNNFNYKGFNLAFVIDVRWGIDQYSQYGNYLSAFGKESYSLDRNSVVVFNGFLADGTRNTKEVWLGQGIGPDGVDYGAGFYRNYLRASSEPFVQDASFVKLRSATLSYNLPSGILSKTPFQRVSIAASVNNIILWTPWTWYDPESFSGGAGTNVTGFTGLDYPGVSTTTFTLNLTL